MTVSNHGSPAGAYGACRRAVYDRRVGRTRGCRRRETAPSRERPDDEESDMAKKARKKKARKKSSANHGKRPNS
ncbi:50S ribosomal protein bL37 [Actinoplanes sp. NPDC049316]|uniref:50S ribosomal protein bL37 n=1 Tax=Actinoplanes sp. NPDC049316 TaxID=3154727 RepID=UPI003421D974